MIRRDSRNPHKFYYSIIYHHDLADLDPNYAALVRQVVYQAAIYGGSESTYDYEGEEDLEMVPEETTSATTGDEMLVSIPYEAEPTTATTMPTATAATSSTAATTEAERPQE